MGMDNTAPLERTAEDRKTALRQYFTRKQREYRHKLKSERGTLLEELAHLQNQLSEVPPAKLIASRDSKGENNHLQAVVDANTSLIYEMTSLLRDSQPRPTASISFVQPAHHYVTLMANSNARAQAKQWLVQQLYHNTDRFFHNFPAISLSEEFADCKAECTGPWIHTVKHCQAIWPNTVEEIKQLFLHPNSQALICGTYEFDVERDGNAVLTRGIFESKWSWHHLQGHFYEADRFVAVFRSLNNDETLQDREDPNFYSMEWLDVRRISSTHSVVRMLVHRTLLIEDAKELIKSLGTVVSPVIQLGLSRRCRHLKRNCNGSSYRK
ncbi:hypothetical protein AeNC1_013950 [Aphanomyces euteiches]|nr:hypothetical protein AeNC1_013950 [Aphanomyces euteiches]